jgi:hypothetical protein
VALIDANSSRRLVPPHEPQSWFEVRPITAGDMEHLSSDGVSQVSVSIDLMATLIRAWSYEPPVTTESIRRLDLDTFVWLGKELLVVSGVRDEPEKKASNGASSPTSANPKPPASPANTATY